MRLPSVLLHDHLDGGLRPRTVVDLAKEVGYEGLPSNEVADLVPWFDQSGSGSLERYLDVFDHTIAVMQTFEAVERVAFEAAIDLAVDGVVYAEIRFCPLLHLQANLTPSQVIEAVSDGMKRGQKETKIEWGLIIDSLRHLHDSREMAQLAVSHADLGVVGFDLAGPEADYPPDDHQAGFHVAHDAGLGITVHAGESGRERGVEYMMMALDKLHAQRLGHGIEIINDCRVVDGSITELGPAADRIHSLGIAIEMCPTSNMATSGIRAAEHPFGLLYRAGFNVLLNTDNRLMSNTSMSQEYRFAFDEAGLDSTDISRIASKSLRAAFCDDETKDRLWQTRLAPEFASAGITTNGIWE